MLIVAEDVESEVLTMLIINKHRAGLKASVLFISQLNWTFYEFAELILVSAWQVVWLTVTKFVFSRLSDSIPYVL